MSELELKFQVPAPALEALRADLLASPGTPPDTVRLRATYFDTDDRLLGRHRMALRLRLEGDTWVQTLKAARPHSVDRLEENADRGVGDGGDAPSLDLALHGDGEAGRLLHALLAQHPGAVLRPRYATDVRRLRHTVALGGTSVEIALDEGEIVAGARRATIREVEFERLSGDASALFHLAGRWQQRHGLWLDIVSKAERGERLAAGDGLAPAVKAGRAHVARGQDAATGLRRIVAAGLAQVLGNASAIVHGAAGDEHVHQARVGLRRLRTALRELGPASGAVDPAWEPALARAFRALGADRDARVLPAQLAPVLAEAGAPLADWREAHAAPAPAPTPSPVPRAAHPTHPPGLTQPGQPTPAAVLVDPIFQRTLLSMLALAEAGDVASGSVPHDAAVPSLRALLRRRLGHVHAQLRRDAARFETLPPDLQHRARKRLKRLRYLADFAAPLFKDKDVTATMRLLEAAQDVLGRLVDEGVAQARFHDAAQAGDARAWFSAGWLAGRRPAHVAASRRALRRLAKARVFWA